MSLFQLLHKAANTIRYNGVYIFLAIIFPYILIVFDAGRDIFESLAEEKSQLSLSLCLVVFFILGYSVWCIPTVAITLFQFFIGTKNENQSSEDSEKLKEQLFQSLIEIYNDKSTAYQLNKTQFPIRWFAVFPWLMFLFTFYWVNCGIIAFTIESITIVVLFIAGHFLYNKYSTRIKVPKKGVQFLLICTIPFLILLMLPYILGNTEFQRFGNFTYGFIAPLSSVLFYYTLRLLEDMKVNYQLSNYNYKFMLCILVLAIIVLYILNNYQLLPEISIVVVLIVMAATMITFFDLYITSQYLLIKISKANIENRNKELTSFRLGLYHLFIIILPVVLIYLCLFSSINSHRIRKSFEANKYVPITQRTTLEKYFDLWFNKNKQAILKDSSIYLISGQGGGSRAAAWFFMNMAQKQKDDPYFFKKIFSISTVSGSSVGAYMFLGTKYYEKSIPRIDSITLQLLARNYMSSAFYGLLIGDGIDGIFNRTISNNANFPKDRNYYLQKEEMNTFEKTFNVDGRDFFEADYMHIYQDTINRYPLFFINTAIVDKGTRGIFSPVELKDISLARDLYKEFKNEDYNGYYNIPLTTCVNQSEAFPLLSAYNFMDNVGRFIDGGLYENTGCETTLEIYQALRKYLNSSAGEKSNLKIVMYNLTSSNLTEDHTASFKNASILNSLTALVNSPFGGHQNYAYYNLSRQVNYMNQLRKDGIKDTVINIPLNKSITLTRSLSSTSINKLYNSLPQNQK